MLKQLQFNKSKQPSQKGYFKPMRIRLSSASCPGALVLKRYRYKKRLHEVTVCEVVGAQGEMGCVHDGKRLADLVAVTANIEISEE